MKPNKSKQIVMLGTSPKTPGGIAAVIQSYQDAGLFQRWPIIYLSTHKEDSNWGKLKEAATTLIRFSSLIFRQKVSLVHVHAASRASFWRKSIFLIISIITFRLTILHLHGGGFMDFYENECNRLQKYIIRAILNNVSKIIVLSQKWKNVLGEITRNENIIILGNPVKIVPDVDICSESKIKNSVIFMGDLTYEKGIYDLLNAIAYARKEVPDLRLDICGVGDSNAVKKYAEDLGVVESLVLHGWVEGNTKHILLKEATILALPSYKEGLPMSILEAMAYGLPVVATNIGGIPDIINNGVEGCLIEPGDIQGLALNITDLLKNRGRRTAMGICARKKVIEHYSADNILLKLGHIYRDLGLQESNRDEPIHI